MGIEGVHSVWVEWWACAGMQGCCKYRKMRAWCGSVGSYQMSPYLNGLMDPPRLQVTR